MPTFPTREERRVIPRRLIYRSNPSGQADPVVQSSSVSPLVSTTSGLNFDGVGQGAYGFTVRAAPPGTNGSGGATQFVQWVNLSFAVFDKSTRGLLYGPATGNTLCQGLVVAA